MEARAGVGPVLPGDDGVSVWFAIPTKRPIAEVAPVLAKWRQQGYKIALLVDIDDYERYLGHLDMADRWIPMEYPGYAAAVNILVRTVLREDQEAEWIVTGGDDIEPDLNCTADQIAHECMKRFLEAAIDRAFPGLRQSDYSGIIPVDARLKTFGVMQPTGDRWGERTPGFPRHEAYIDRVCGSPWLGREFCRRMYGGQGPLHPGYAHMYVDEELFEVAKAMGILWQRRDLIHYHRHWARQPGTMMNECPAFLREANSPEGWAGAKALFHTRKAAGFPGHQPCS